MNTRERLLATVDLNNRLPELTVVPMETDPGRIGLKAYTPAQGMGEYVGEIEVGIPSDVNGIWPVMSSGIEGDYIGHGYGSRLYLEMASLVYGKGGVLGSDSLGSVSYQAAKLWERFIRLGVARQLCRYGFQWEPTDEYSNMGQACFVRPDELPKVSDLVIARNMAEAEAKAKAATWDEIWAEVS